MTSEKGTGKPYYIEGYDVIGKTGTAQIPNPNGGYLEGYKNYIYSFLGMAPKDDPQVIIMLQYSSLSLMKSSMRRDQCQYLKFLNRLWKIR